MTFRRFATLFGVALGTAVAVGVITNLPDIARYIRITRM
jgi:hypothetical protein